MFLSPYGPRRAFHSFPTRRSSDLVRLVSVILAHNETGVIQDIAPLVERCRRFGIPFHLDAVQAVAKLPVEDRKSTRLNSSHDQISYAVFCLKKKNISLPQAQL